MSDERLTPEDREFRRLVEGLEGHQELIASCLGRERSTISRKLNSKKHGSWWRAYKKRRSKDRKRLCQERWRLGYEKRRLANGGHPLTSNEGHVKEVAGGEGANG